ncbi:MAG: FAD-binding protein, partial [Dehalobacterium sp.]
MNRMKKKYDVIVIGGGLAGIQAALSAKNSQTEVLLIAKGFGSFYYGSGVIDLLGATQEKLITRPWSNLDNLSCFHPYKILGENQVRQGLAEFYQLMEETGYPLITNDQGENFFLPTALGSIRPT